MAKTRQPKPFRVRYPTLQDPRWHVLSGHGERWQSATDLRLLAPTVSDPKTHELVGMGVVECLERGVISVTV